MTSLKKVIIRAILVTCLSIGILFGVALTLWLLPIKDFSAWRPSAEEDPETVTMIAMGDQGRGDYRQRRVAALLEAVCRDLPELDFIQTLGDNFYFDGVASVDDPLWAERFEDMYDTPCLAQQDFYAALGNHDYGLSPQAQVDYAQGGYGSGRWRMPARYYVHRHGTSTGRDLVTVVVLDTNQPLEAQLALIRDTFADSEASVWRVVAAHHNIRTYSEEYADDRRFLEALLPTLRAFDVHFYVSGHSHNLQLIEFTGEPLYIIAGGGGRAPRSVQPADPAVQKLALRSLGFAALTFRPDAVYITYAATSGSFLSLMQHDTYEFSVTRRCMNTHARPCIMQSTQR